MPTTAKTAPIPTPSPLDDTASSIPSQSQPEPLLPSSPVPPSSLFLVPAPGSNAWGARHDVIPCETNPQTGALSRQREAFHARATMTVGAEGTERRHVCEPCQKRWHRFNKIERGVTWMKVRGKAAASASVAALTEAPMKEGESE